jgi:formate dehydrogenase major subunit
MAEGKVKGLFLFGQNPAGGAPNAGLNRVALRQLDWLAMRNWFEIESACHWYKGPEGPDPHTIRTEIFFMPAAAAAEKNGCFTNTQRLLQWHDKAVDPPDDCRADTSFVCNLGKRIKRLYAGSTAARDQGLLNLTWDYERDGPEPLPDGSRSRIHDEPDAEKILKGINGYTVGIPKPGGDHPRGRRLLKPQERDIAVHRRVRYASRNQSPKRLALADLEITLNTASCWFE